MDEIKAIRTKLGISQQEFGSRLGVTQARVSEWESGKKPPNARTILAAKFLLIEAGSGASTGEAA